MPVFIVDQLLNEKSASEKHKEATEEWIYNHIQNRLRPNDKWGYDESDKYGELSDKLWAEQKQFVIEFVSNGLIRILDE